MTPYRSIHPNCPVRRGCGTAFVARISLTGLLTLSVGCASAGAVEAENVPATGTYRDASLPIDQRVQDLIGRMSLNEKVGQLNQTIYGWKTYERKNGELVVTDVLTNEAEHWGGIGAIYGVLRADPWSGVTWDTGALPEERAKLTNLVQATIMEHSRWRIPALFSNELSHGHMAIGGVNFPTAIGMGSTWNPALYEKAVHSMATELRLSGEHFALISCLDVARDPRWGRTEECFGEDGYLVSTFARAATLGVQGDDPAAELTRMDRAAVVLKHLAGQGAPLGGHNAAAANIGPREFNEIHLPPARAGALAGARSFMVAYNEIDGIPCCTNPVLLKHVLRDTYGFRGVMMADGTALDILRNQAGTFEEAGIRAVSAGVDLSLWDNAFRTLGDSVEAGNLDESVIDEALANVLHLKFEMGLFEKPFVEEDPTALKAAIAESRKLNLDVARESLVLLKNEGGVLPFKRDVKRVAVIGPNADYAYAQTGDYTAPQKPGETTTVLGGVRALLGPDVEVVTVQGCAHRGTDTSGIPAAVALAKSADVVIVAVGGSSNRFAGTKYNITGAAEIDSGGEAEMDTGEGVDVADLDLGGVQRELVQALQATGKPLAVVLIQGRPFTIPWIADNCSAILNAWYPGQEGGHAIAEVLFGEVNPSGRLSISMPRSVGQLPVAYDYKFRGDRPYYGMSPLPLYSFGYGLSYTTFDVSNLRLSQSEMTAAALNDGATLTLSVDVTNSGERAGKETVQVYVHGVVSEITRRIRELKAFDKVELQPGETRTLTFEIGKEQLAIWGRDMVFDVGTGVNELIVQGGNTEPLKAVLKVD